MAVKRIKPSDREQVETFLNDLAYPLKDVLQALREVIISSSDKLKERIKWNAPSYYADVDLLTLNLRSTEYVMIVFHHISIVEIKEEELKGDYKDRRLMYFHSLEDVQQKSVVLQHIIREYVKLAETPAK